MKGRKEGRKEWKKEGKEGRKWGDKRKEGEKEEKKKREINLLLSWKYYHLFFADAKEFLLLVSYPENWLKILIKYSILSIESWIFWVHEKLLQSCPALATPWIQ